MDLFSKYGYSDVSIRDIADEIGVTERVVCKHYENKNDILEAILDYYKGVSGDFVPPKKNLERLTKDATTDDVIKCLYIYFPEDEKHYIKTTHILFQEHTRNNEVREFFENNMITWQEGYIASLLQRLVEVGAISDRIDIEHWSRVHVGMTYYFMGRHVLGIGDMLPGFTGRRMEEIIRGLYDRIFELYGTKQ
jgi:AcrR family transcriptional regulator